jgi:5-methylcytosine-specific restriction endonuclease McrA
MRNPISVVSKWLCSLGEPPRSPHWPRVRAQWLAHHPTCAACGGTLNIEVHHKKPFHLFPALELDPKNFLTLCEPMGIEHHLKVGHTIGGKSSWKIYNVNVVADAATILSSEKT